MWGCGVGHSLVQGVWGAVLCVGVEWRTCVATVRGWGNSQVGRGSTRVPAGVGVGPLANVLVSGASFSCCYGAL